MTRTIWLILLLAVSGCSNTHNGNNSYNNQNQTPRNISQQEQICSALEELPAEIKDLSIKLYYAEQKLTEIQSSSDLLLNPVGWLGAVNNEQQVESERNQISHQLEIKKNLYTALSKSHLSTCSQKTSAESRIDQYCEIMSLVVKEITVRRDNGIPQQQASNEIPSITSQINEHLNLNGALNETTTKTLTSTLRFIYANPGETPEVIYSSFRRGCSESKR